MSGSDCRICWGGLGGLGGFAITFWGEGGLTIVLYVGWGAAGDGEAAGRPRFAG